MGHRALKRRLHSELTGLCCVVCFVRSVLAWFASSVYVSMSAKHTPCTAEG